jgi:5'-nucleotidase (lipoprotein e(P4) family)
MPARRALRTCLAAALAALAAACAATSPRPLVSDTAEDRCGGEPIFAAGGDRAMLWIRNSSEYRAASESVYRAAETALAKGLADPAWTAEPAQAGDLAQLQPAVVMDIDETVLDNSEPQLRLLREGTCFGEFPAAWDQWVAERRAPAVPGAVEFIRGARAMKDASGRPVRVVFVTNRECARRAGSDADCPQKEDTVANLAALGLDVPTLADDVLLKGGRAEWGAEKLSRRQEIAGRYRIVLNIGDDLADFLPDIRRATVAERDRARCARDAYWGQRWFMLPNPLYGSWLVALGPSLDAALAAEPEVMQGCPAR